MRINEYAKAVTAGLVTFGLLFDAATAAGSVGGDGVTSAEWVRIAVGTAVAGLGVFLVPNTPSGPEPAQKAPEGYVSGHRSR